MTEPYPDVAKALAVLAPLRVREAEYQDPTLILVGDNWSLSVTCPWRLSREGEVIGDWEEDSDHDEIWDLIGHDLLAVDAVDPTCGPLALLLTGGYRLEISPDTDLDPWVMGLPDVTYVGGVTPG